MATEIKSTSIKSQNLIAEPVANKPASPEQGQIIQANGTGNIAKGIYQYSGASWVSLDNAQGDLETLRLIMSTDTDAVGFSSALNSTSTLAGNTNAIPHETSTGTGMLGALEIPSTGGDALLTEFDANKVFRYYSAGANNNNDYFGIPVDIPAQTRGQNIVIKFKYRTEEASAASSNGDFQVSVWDKSNGVKTTSTNTSTVAAGAAITVASSTGMAVGDKIWLESGGNAVNNVGNSITEAYITEVTNSTTIEISETWTPASTAGSLVVSGWLSDKTSGLLPSADSDTNKVGKDFSIAVKTEEDTAQVVVWFSNKSTTTNVIELFLDGILVSQNKFLQVETQLPYERYFAVGGGLVGTTGAFDKSISWSTGTVVTNTIKHTATVEESASNGWTMTMLQDCKINMNATVYDSSDTFNYLGILVNSYDPGDTAYSLATGGNGGVVAINEDMRPGSAGDMHTSCFWSGNVKKGDVIRVQTYQDPTGGGASRIWVDAQPLPSTSIVLESQDEIFTSYTPWTPTISGYGASVNQQFQWRRNGSNMEMLVFIDPGTANGDHVYFTIPSGYNIDYQKLGKGAGGWNHPIAAAGFNTYNAGNYMWVVNNGYDNRIYLGVQNGTNSNFNPQAGTGFGSSEMSGFISVPIVGWNTNFNPLLSMPLVELGGAVEEYSVAGNATDSTNETYRPYFNSTGTEYIVNKNTINLYGTVDNNSTQGWNFKASQRCIVTWAGSFGNNSAGGQWALIKTPHAPWTGTTASDNPISNAQFDSFVLGGGVAPQTGGETSRQTFRFVMEPGEYIQVVKSFNGNESMNYITGIYMCVEKDFANTNMAHIIKPAVAMLKDIKAYNVEGGTSTAGTNTRVLNTVNGESWFVSLTGTGTTGVGGSNTDFTLEPGTYKIVGNFEVYKSDRTFVWLYDVTNSTSLSQYVGSTSYQHSGTGIGSGQAHLHIPTLTITSSTEFNIKHYVETGLSTEGWGVAHDQSGYNTCYATLQIEKLK